MNLCALLAFLIVYLSGVGAKIPRSCLFLHVPLESSDLQQTLRAKGFNGNRPSIWAMQICGRLWSPAIMIIQMNNRFVFESLIRSALLHIMVNKDVHVICYCRDCL